MPDHTALTEWKRIEFSVGGEHWNELLGANPPSSSIGTEFFAGGTATRT